MKRIRVLLFLTTVVSLITGFSLRIIFPGASVDERAVLRAAAPGMIFSEKAGAPPHYQTMEGAVAFNSYDVTPSIRGYAGPIKVMIVLTPEGRIAGLRILEHHETKNYVHHMEGPDYLQRFTGKSVRDPFVVDKDVDAISRATVSVEALAQTVRESSRAVSAATLGITVAADGYQGKRDLRWLWYPLLFLTAFVFYLLSKKYRRYLRTRDFLLAASIVITGLYLSSPFSVLQVFNLMLGRPSSSILWYVVVVSALISIILAGRFYCGWICPFGALSEFIARMPSRKWEMSVEFDDRWRRFKYAALALIAAVVLVTGRPDYGNIETYVTLFSVSGTFLAWGLVIVTLAANLRIPRFWCRYLCPVAAFTGVLSRKTTGYPSRHDCPMANRPNPLISECIRCNRCYTGRA